MNKNWIIAIIVIAVVAFAGWYFVAGQSTKSASQDEMMKKDSMMKEEPSASPTEDKMMKTEPSVSPSEESMMKKDDASAGSEQDKMMEDKDKMMEKSGN